MKNVVEIYDREAASYDQRYVKPIHIVEDRIIADMINARYTEGDHVFDIGCGTGHVITITDIPKEDYAGFDISPGMVEVARKKFPGHVFKIVDVRDIGWNLGSAPNLMLAVFGQANYLGLEYFVHALNRMPETKFLAVLYSGIDNPDCEYTKEYQTIYSPEEIRASFSTIGRSVSISGLSHPHHGISDPDELFKDQISKLEDLNESKYFIIRG